MTVSVISNHVELAIGRLIDQYKGKANIEGLVTAFNQEFQNLEEVGQDLYISRTLAQAVGIQLDLFGTIIDQGREGFDDDFYRVLLNVKIGQNVSSGEPISIINTLKLLTEATLVHYQNLGGANVQMGINNPIPDELINFIYTNLERVVMAGVNVRPIVLSPSDEPFSFDGTGPVGLGYSSLAAPLEGGKLSQLIRRSTPFAYVGISQSGDKSSEGYGAIADPDAGGIYVGL